MKNHIFILIKKIVNPFIIFIIGIFIVFNISVIAQNREEPVQNEPGELISKISCLEQGKELYREQKYDEAIEKLEECAELDPDNPEIFFFIAQSYFQQGQSRSLFSGRKYYKQAYDVSDTAIEKYLLQIENYPDKDHTNDYLRLAYMYEIRSIIPGVDEYQEALDIYQKILIEKPYLTSPYIHMGWIYYQQNDYQAAIDIYLKYLESGAKSDSVYYHLGLSYDKIGEKEKAEYYFQLILEEFPDTEMADRAKKEL